MQKISDLMNLEGRRALITGAAGGIGRKIVEAIAEMGGSLVVVDLPNSHLDKLSSDIRKHWSVEVLCLECDLEDEDQRKALINNIKSDGNGLDILINNAGFVGTSDLEGWVTDFEHQAVATWRRAIEVNLTAAFDLSQGLTPLLKASEKGSIVNIASIYAENGPDYSLYEGTNMGNPAAYGISKAGLLQLTRWLSTTLAPSIRVNAISPGGVFRGQPESFVQRYETRTPLKRMATEDDFKGAIAFFVTDLSDYVTGQNLSVDGGWGVW